MRPLAASALMLAASCADKAPTQSPEDITLFSADGTPLAARRYRLADAHGNPPGLLLVSEAGASLAPWDAFAEKARSMGYVLLATAPRSTEAPLDPERAREDLVAGREALVDAGADPDRLAAVAANGAACLAVDLARHDLEVLALVLLSPTEDCPGYDLLGTLALLRDCPLLLVVCDQDSEASAAARRLDDAARGFCELRLFPGNHRGLDIPAASPSAARHVFKWLEQVLPR